MPIFGTISSANIASPIITGNVNIDSNTLFVDGVNNRVGFGKANPATTLDVAGRITTSNSIATEFNVISHVNLFSGGKTGYISVPSGSNWTKITSLTTDGGITAWTNSWYWDSYFSGLQYNKCRLTFAIQGAAGYNDGTLQIFETRYNATQPNSANSGNIVVRTGNITGASDRGLNFIVTEPFHPSDDVYSPGGDSRILYVRHNIPGSMYIYTIGLDVLRIS